MLYSRQDAAYQLSLSVRALDYLIAGGRILVPYYALVRFANADRMAPMVPAKRFAA